MAAPAAPWPGRRAWRLLALAALVAAQLLAAGPASAAPGTQVDVLFQELRVLASPGFANQITISSVSLPTGRAFLVTDTGDAVDASGGCVQAGPNQATCSILIVSALRVEAGDLDDTVTNLTGTRATLNGGAGTDTLNGGGGHDLLDGGTGPDDLHGGTGTDTATYASRAQDILVDIDDVADDGDMNQAEGDNVRTDVENVVGGSQFNNLTGNAGPNQLTGGPITDFLKGGGGDDVLLAGGGDDIVLADEVIPAQPTGDDLLDGGAGDDDLRGDGGDDELLGRAGADNLVGANGHDLLDGGAGPDDLSGGDGVDTVTYADRTVRVFAEANGVADDGEATERDDIAAGVDNFIGGAGDDLLAGAGSGAAANNRLVGGPGVDLLVGRGGNDTLLGGPGDDQLNGNEGDDVLDGQAGADVMRGEAGRDVVTYASRLAPVVASLNTNLADDGEAGEGDTILSSVDNLVGGAGPDTLSGDDAANVLAGGSGDDLLRGLGGFDELYGEEGFDGLNGGAANDLCVVGPDGGTVINCEF